MDSGSDGDYSSENSDVENSEREALEDSDNGSGDDADSVFRKVAAIKEGAKLRDRVKATDIHTAVWENDIAVVEKFLEMDRSLATERDDTDFGENFQPLHYAAYQGHMQLMDLLCSRGAQVNAQTDGGCTPLYFAAQQGHTECVNYLLNQNADISLCEKEHGFTAVDVGRANKEIFEALKSKADPPLKPAPPRIGRANATALEVFYEPLTSSRGVLPVKSYKVKVFKITEEEDNDKVVEIAVARPGANPIIIKGLEPETQYKVQIAAVNSVGFGKYSELCDPVKTSSAKENQTARRTSRAK